MYVPPLKSTESSVWMEFDWVREEEEFRKACVRVTLVEPCRRC